VIQYSLLTIQGCHSLGVSSSLKSKRKTNVKLTVSDNVNMVPNKKENKARLIVSVCTKLFMSIMVDLITPIESLT
jgi:hypothetical protein